MEINLDKATSAALTARHAYVTYGGRRFRSYKRIYEPVLSWRGTNGPKKPEELSEIEKNVIIESFRQHGGRELTWREMPEYKRPEEAEIISVSVPKSLVLMLREEASKTGEGISKIVTRRLKESYEK